MVAAVRVHKPGGPEVLTYEEVEIGAPGQGQIRVKQHACGVNFIDTYFRMGMYPAPGGMPFIAGNEAPAKSSRSGRASPISRSATGSPMSSPWAAMPPNGWCLPTAP